MWCSGALSGDGGDISGNGEVVMPCDGNMVVVMVVAGQSGNDTLRHRGDGWTDRQTDRHREGRSDRCLTIYPC